MAVLMRSELRGVDPEQIRLFSAQRLDQMKTFPGFIAHAAGPLPDGYQVTEVWESQEAHERWVREVIAPQAMQQLGVTEALPVTYLPLDRFVTR